jgi:hypothetical protein
MMTTVNNSELAGGCGDIADELAALEQRVEQVSATLAEYDRLLRPVADAIALASRLASWAAVNFQEQSKEEDNDNRN